MKNIVTVLFFLFCLSSAFTGTSFAATAELPSTNNVLGEYEIEYEYLAILDERGIHAIDETSLTIVIYSLEIDEYEDEGDDGEIITYQTTWYRGYVKGFDSFVSLQFSDDENNEANLYVSVKLPFSTKRVSLNHTIFGDEGFVKGYIDDDEDGSSSYIQGHAEVWPINTTLPTPGKG